MLRDSNVIANEVVHVGHLYFIVNDVGGEIPESYHILEPFGQLVELAQSLLLEVVEVEFEGHKTIVGLQTLSDHLQPIIINSVASQVQMD